VKGNLINEMGGFGIKIELVRRTKKVKLLVWHRVRESIWLNEELESTQKEMFDGRNNIDIWNRDTNMAPTFDNAQLLICVGRGKMESTRFIYLSSLS